MKYGLVLFCLLGSSLLAGWNEKYDEETECLCRTFEALDTSEYRKYYEDFSVVRQKSLEDKELRKEIGKMSSSSKKIFLRKKDGTVIKKRPWERLGEAYVWEISALLGSPDCIVPSFPVEIGGKKVVLQKKASFTTSDVASRSLIKQISCAAYWKAHLQAYLFGMGDLVARNIGITKKNEILFFDIESSFKYRSLKRSKLGFHTGFLSHSLTWPQFQKPLTREEAISVRYFIDSLANIRDTLDRYLDCRSGFSHREGLLYRLDKILEFPLEEGCSFFDFYSFLFPELFKGIEEWCEIVSEWKKKSVGIGEALMIARKKIGEGPISREQRQRIMKWLDRYVQEPGGNP